MKKVKKLKEEKKKKNDATHQAFVVVGEFVDDFINDTVRNVGGYCQVQCTENTHKKVFSFLGQSHGGGVAEHS